MHLAAWTGNLDIASMLMDGGAEVNAVDKSGFTPLDVLFHPCPPYLQQEREAKRLIIDNFEKARKEIYSMLKIRGAIHKMRATGLERVTDEASEASTLS